MAQASTHTSVADRIDRFSAAVGRSAAWLCLFMVLVQFAVVVLRYAFGIGSIWLQELIVYAHAAHVSPGRGLDLARGWACAGRHLLFNRIAAHESPDRSARRASFC